MDVQTDCVDLKTFILTEEWMYRLIVLTCETFILTEEWMYRLLVLTCETFILTEEWMYRLLVLTCETFILTEDLLTLCIMNYSSEQFCILRLKNNNI